MNVLISTIPLILFFFDRQKRKIVELKEPKAYTSADIGTSRLIGKNGNIWFASMSNGETFREFKTGSGLRDHMVRYLYPDQERNIWIGTNGNRNGGWISMTE